MDKTLVIDVIKQLRDGPKRKFSQSIDFILVLKNLQKTDKVDHYIDLPNATGKIVKVCALVGTELAEQAKKECEHSVVQDKFVEYAKDKKKIKKLAKECDFFIAQANIMVDVAKTFGRVLGPYGKMPNPKAGCVVPPAANLKAVKERLQKKIKVSSNKNNNQIVQIKVASETMKDEDIADNVMMVYNTVLGALPQHENNLRKAFLKFTMSKPILVERGKEE